MKEKNRKKKKLITSKKIPTRVVFLGTNKLILLVFLTLMLRFELFGFRYKHVMIILRNDPSLLINDLRKTEFCGNFGAILDFPGIPNESKY